MKTTNLRLEGRLEAWGEWCLKHQYPHLGYPATSFEFRHWVRSGVKFTHTTHPTFAREEQTESWVKHLHQQHPRYAIVLRHHYTTVGSTLSKAKQLRLPYTTYRERLSQAKTWLLQLQRGHKSFKAS